MKSERKRLVLMAAIGSALAALVLADRLTATQDPAGEAPSRAAELRSQTDLVSRMRLFIDNEEQWRSAHASALDAWERVRPRLIAATTAELANAQLQRKIAAIVADVGVTLAATSAPSVETPTNELPLRIIGLTLSIKAPTTEQLYSFIDRIEHMPDAWTHISRLQAQGPRRIPTTGIQDVQLELEALAWIGDGGERDAR